MNRLQAEFTETFPASLQLYTEALRTFPGGVTHDNRYLAPFPVYIARASGSRKWDVDGHELIDYWLGHGALLLGHNHPAVVQAVAEQLTRGTHYGASHEAELRWGQAVQKLVPGAERGRFVSSGTEAALMAVRLARGATGKNRLIRFQGHYHGWHDEVSLGYKPPFDAPSSVGIPPEMFKNVVVLPPNDLDAVEQALARNPDVAAVVLEPAGGSNAAIPARPGFLRGLRDLCDRYRAVLIFDEVISGFRYAPGGAQEFFGVRADLVMLAKIVAGGLPGGAVAGSAAIMELMAFTGDVRADRHERVLHMGTFNANPLSAAAGVATLEIIASGEPQRQAGQMTLRLIDGMNAILRAERVPGCVYGDIGGFHLFVGQAGFSPDDAANMLDKATPERLIAGMGGLLQPFRAALLLEGVDPSGQSGRLSCAHTAADVELTLAAFARALGRLRRWGVLPR